MADLAQMGTDITEYLDAKKGTGLALEGIELVQDGDHNVPTQFHPCVTVDWDHAVKPVWTGNHWEMAARFAVTLYTVTLQALGGQVAGKNAQRLLFRYDSGWKGLIPALMPLQSYTDNQGRVWRVAMDSDIEQSVITSKKHKHWTTVTTVSLTLSTWLDKSEFS
ncbi:MAG: hypothetical protein AB7S38_29010 [Vulcanimicrobiota bacterium]